jgi:outer membrane receptor protein involved in Fe transport
MLGNYRMRKSTFFILSFIFTGLLSGQIFTTITGNIVDANLKTPLVGTNVLSDNSEGTSTDANGNFTLNVNNTSRILTISYRGFATQIIPLDLGEVQMLNLRIELKPSFLESDVIVVSASAFEKRIEEETVSIDVIKPYLIQKSNPTDISQSIEKVPGVKLIDGQVSIRSGAGWSYSVGSRVQVLVDGQSYLTADLGEVRWKFIPTNVEQVEIIKGASSVLYGSSSMNGVINILTGWAKDEPETDVTFFTGIYGKPERTELAWWNWNDSTDVVKYGEPGIDVPSFSGVSFNHRQKIGNDFDLVIGGRLSSENSYLKNIDEYKAGINFKTRYSDPRVQGLYYGINGNIMHEKNSRFFLFHNADTLAYVPWYDEEEIGTNSRDYYHIHSFVPHISYFTPKGNSHKLTAMYYNVSDIEDDEIKPSIRMTADYQFQKKLWNILVMTNGIKSEYGKMANSDLYGGVMPFTYNYSFYSQADIKLDNLTIMGGFRKEILEITDLDKIDSTLVVDVLGEQTGILQNVKITPKPVIRTGLNYQLFNHTYLRASYGQAFRYPSISEKYMHADLNGINIMPNINLQAESGWSSELGIKQNYLIGNGKGYVDAALFWMEYDNYIEYNMGLHEIVIQETGFPYPVIGYTPYNVERARIVGYELSSMGEFDLLGMSVKYLGGYTYTYPADLSAIENRLDNKSYWDFMFDSFDGINTEEWKDNNGNGVYDSVYILEYTYIVNSDGIVLDSIPKEPDEYIDTNGNGVFDNEAIYLLKYRHRKSARLDVEASNKNFSIGFSFNYNSGIERIDRYIKDMFEQFIPGIGTYDYSKAYTIIDMQLGYELRNSSSISLMVKNLTNLEYATRPGALGAPRSITLQYSTSF